MVLDHIGEIFFPSNLWLLSIGRIAFPLFAWGIAIGFKRSRNPSRYAFRLFMISVISQVPHFLLFESKYLNVCFTLLLGLLTIITICSNIDKRMKLGIIALIFVIAHLAKVEYGIYGLLTILIFFYFQNVWISIPFHAVSIMSGILIYHFSEIQWYAIFSILVVIYLAKYDLKFRISKLFGYGFYPAHLILLLLINNITIR